MCRYQPQTYQTVYKQTLVDLVLWLTLLSDSDEKVGKHSTTSCLCSFKPCKVGVTKSQTTVYLEYCDGTYSICVSFFIYPYYKYNSFGRTVEMMFKEGKDALGLYFTWSSLDNLTRIN